MRGSFSPLAPLSTTYGPDNIKNISLYLSISGGRIWYNLVVYRPEAIIFLLRDTHCSKVVKSFFALN